MKQWVCWLAALVSLPFGCARAADSRSERLCITGETRLCTGEAGCRGAETCQADGQSFAGCDCGATLVEDNAVADAGEERAVFDELGAPCSSDRDCGPRLMCWPASARNFAGRAGGASGGYCTAPCETLDDCTAIEPNAGCGDGLCMLGCYSGEPGPGEFKCRDRADLACWSSAALGVTPFDATVRQSGLCLPSCGSDDDCEGRTCDLALRLCVDTPTVGAPIGAPCDNAEACAGGICQASTAGLSFCTALCSYGSFGCGYGLNAAPRDAMCLTPAVFDRTGSEGTGDVGVCLELCDVPADCAQPGWQCLLVPEARGRSGACVGPAPALGVDAGIAGETP